MTRQEVFARCRSGVAQVILERGAERLTAGTAFLVPGGVVTNTHVVRGSQYDRFVLRFEEMDNAAAIRMFASDAEIAIAHESPVNEHDVVFMQMDEREFAGRHVFTFGDSQSLQVGDEVGFLGFPFSMTQLTAHLGYVSSLRNEGPVKVIQIDGSVNGGNSGGPLVSLEDGSVMGIVSRAEVGFFVDQFDELIGVLGQNVAQLANMQGGARIVVGGVDPVQGLLSSQQALRDIAVNVRRSANVGIGYAYGSDFIRNKLQ